MAPDVLSDTDEILPLNNEQKSGKEREVWSSCNINGVKLDGSSSKIVDDIQCFNAFQKILPLLRKKAHFCNICEYTDL